MSTARSAFIASATLVLGFLFLLSGCDTSVNPILGSEQPFSIYGVLHPEEDSQWVRVFPIEDQLEVSDEPLGATVVSIEESTGNTITWEYKQRTGPEGLPAHLFLAPFEPEFGTKYTVEVRHAERGTTTVDVRVPPRAEIEVGDATFGPRIPIDINNQAPNDNPPIENVINVVADYTVQYTVAQTEDSLPEVTIPIKYTEHAQKVDGGWQVNVDLSTDFDTLRERLRRRELYNMTFGIGLKNIHIEAMPANKEWSPPGGEFDPDVLVQPGTMSNVSERGGTTGLGFVGAGYLLTEDFRPGPDVRRRAGFRQD